jgi:uncharacterized caspase-like protein
MRRPVFRDLLFATGLMVLQVATCCAAETRVALVIGQSAYLAVPALPNAANDAKAMAELLGHAGFEVTAAPDQSQNGMRQAISDFAAKVAGSGPDAVALVFYAGHGLQIDGENYLVPVDVDPKREADIPLQAVRLNDLMNTLGALPTRMRIFMLDACRNNPFPALGQAGHGLAMVDTRAGAPGSFISFSTSPGAEAEDGSGADSPYTTAVLAIAREPNLTIEEAFKRVRVAVNKATDGRQIPWESSSLTSDFKFFADGNGPAATSPKPPATTARTTSDWRRDLKGEEPKAALERVIADDEVEGYEAFVEVFAQSPLGPRVRLLLERRRLMLAWNTAVAINTAASLDAFLANYPDSDLAATARKMRERVRNRSFGAVAAITPAVLAPTNVALAPTCPCSAPTTPAPPSLKRKVEVTPEPTRHADKPPRKHRPPPDDDVVVERGPPGPPPVYIPPGAVMQGAGIGIGLGGFGGRGGGMGGGGGGFRR